MSDIALGVFAVMIWLATSYGQSIDRGRSGHSEW
jgi:hypothetical protein